jgi:cyanophycinase
VSVFALLIGGGWRPEGQAHTYGPFLDAAGACPDVACVVVDDDQGMEQFARWRDALATVARCSPAPVLVPVGSLLSPADLEGADALLVCGGLTPAYADAVAPVAEQVRSWLAASDRPYAGFSAGAAVAADTAVVGAGFRTACRSVRRRRPKTSTLWRCGRASGWCPSPLMCTARAGERCPD